MAGKNDKFLEALKLNSDWRSTNNNFEFFNRQFTHVFFLYVFINKIQRPHSPLQYSPPQSALKLKAIFVPNGKKKLF